MSWSRDSVYTLCANPNRRDEEKEGKNEQDVCFKEEWCDVGALPSVIGQRVVLDFEVVSTPESAVVSDLQNGEGSIAE